MTAADAPGRHEVGDVPARVGGPAVRGPHDALGVTGWTVCAVVVTAVVATLWCAVGIPARLPAPYGQGVVLRVVAAGTLSGVLPVVTLVLGWPLALLTTHLLRGAATERAHVLGFAVVGAVAAAGITAALFASPGAGPLVVGFAVEGGLCAGVGRWMTGVRRRRPSRSRRARTATA